MGDCLDDCRQPGWPIRRLASASDGASELLPRIRRMGTMASGQRGYRLAFAYVEAMAGSAEGSMVDTRFALSYY